MEDQPKKRGWWKLAIGAALTVAFLKPLADTLNESHNPLLALLKFLLFWGFAAFVFWVIVLGIYRRITKKRPTA